MKRNKIVLPILVGLLLILAMPVQAAVQPIDIKAHWAEAEINASTSEGWAYIENDKFNPNKPASREEVIWMLIGACGTVKIDGFDANKKADMTVFKDEPSLWAKERMAVAIGNGYIQGYTDGTIKARANITRAEFAVMLGRLITGSPSQNVLPFSDKIPDWSMDGIKKVYGKSIIKGYEDKTFKPDNNLTKAEALVMIKRWKDNLSESFTPLSGQYKKIRDTVKYTNVSEDNIKLVYYGKEGKSSPNDPGKYFIDRVGDDYSIALNDFSRETLNSLAETLKIFIPNGAEKVINELHSSDNQEISFKSDNRNINVKKFATHDSIYLMDNDGI